jgi:hypothetical protein
MTPRVTSTNGLTGRFADATLVIALGVTADGTKRFLRFVETDTENEKVLAPFLRTLVERGLDGSHGLLVVIDGGKGLRAAVRQVFKRSAVQRCMWHKRENVVSYLPKSEQANWRRRLQHAYDRPTYTEAQAALAKLHRELEDRNQSAAASLAEGLEETLTLPARRRRVAGGVVQDHQLPGVHQLAGRGALRQGGRLEDFEPEAALVGHRAARHRAAVAAGQGPPPPVQAGGGAASCTEYQRATDSGTEGRLINI